MPVSAELIAASVTVRQFVASRLLNFASQSAPARLKTGDNGALQPLRRTPLWTSLVGNAIFGTVVLSKVATIDRKILLGEVVLHF